MEINANVNANILSNTIWSIADTLRGGMDANEFRNYILGTIFYRYLSERTEKYMDDLLANDHVTYEQAYADEEMRPIVEEWSKEKLGYLIKPCNLYRELYRKIVKPESDSDRFSIEDYDRAISEFNGSIAPRAQKALDNLFSDMRLKDTRLGDQVSERTTKIASVISKIAEIDMDNYDVLGSAYMDLIGRFQSGAGKKGGEFFTPFGPAKVCAALATFGLDEAKNVADCTCGSGSMMLETVNHLKNKKVGHFYGQENNPTTYNLARMNMLLHGIDYDRFDIYKGDTLVNDLFVSGDTNEPLKLTVQVCNPPYSLKWSSSKKFLDDPRFAMGLAPKSYADFAFVEHMIYHMDDDDGRVAVILPHGVLFRSGAEEEIRKHLIRDLNKLDAVVGMPGKLFHGTDIPVAILLFKSNRGNNKDNILFIDASCDFVSGKKNNEVTEQHVKKIIDAYANRVDVDKYAHVATMDEIIRNNYNLNIPRYVDTSEMEEPVDLKAIQRDLTEISAKKQEAISMVTETMKMLGLWGA